MTHDEPETIKLIKQWIWVVADKHALASPFLFGHGTVADVQIFVKKNGLFLYGRIQETLRTIEE